MRRNVSIIQVFMAFLCLMSYNLLAQEEQNILFIGNSLTSYNNMPALFKSLAASKGKHVSVEQYAPGGAGLVNHVNDPNVYSIISSRNWEAVILQPGTGESVGASSFTDLTIARGQRLIDSIRKYSPCAKIILYEISNGIAPNGASGGNYANYFAFQTMIRDTITRISNGLGVPFAPAGECFRSYYTNNQDLLLHAAFSDVHPNASGSYLVACSIFSTLYQESLFQSNFISTLPAQRAELFQHIADSVVLLHKDSWNINTYNLWADFSFVANGMSLQLQNLSTNYDSVGWNIDNEFFTNTTSPTYTFSSSGTKEIQLTAYRNGCMDTSAKRIHISPSSLQEIKSQNFSVYPSCVQDYLYVKAQNNDNTTCYVMDMNGKRVIANQNLTNGRVDVSSLSVGVYVIVLTQNLQQSKLKFVKIN